MQPAFRPLKGWLLGRPKPSSFWARCVNSELSYNIFIEEQLTIGVIRENIFSKKTLGIPPSVLAVSATGRQLCPGGGSCRWNPNKVIGSFIHKARYAWGNS
jgi:hypothetical protein